jgi:hypothetical protein
VGVKGESAEKCFRAGGSQSPQVISSQKSLTSSLASTPVDLKGYETQR